MSKSTLTFSTNELSVRSEVEDGGDGKYRLRQKLLDYLAASDHLDFTKVTHFNSAGLGVLFQALAQYRDKTIQVMSKSPLAQALEIMKIAKLAKVECVERPEANPQPVA